MQTGRDYIHQHYGHELYHLYEYCCPHLTMKADLFRICYLLKESGIYVDIDINCYTNLNKIYEYQESACFFLYAQGQPSCIENGFIVCEPNSFILDAILKRMQDHLTREQNFSNVWEHTGPGVVTMAIMQLLLDEITSHGNSEMLRNHLKLGNNNIIHKAYNIVHLAYTNTQEGNWRGFSVPKSIYKL